MHGSLWCSGVKPQSLTAGNESSAHSGKEAVVQPQPPVHEDSAGASQSPQECGCSLTLALHLQQPGPLVSHPALGLHLSAKLLSEKFREDHFAFLGDVGKSLDPQPWRKQHLLYAGYMVFAL